MIRITTCLVMRWFVLCFLLAGVEILADDNSIDAIVTSQNRHSTSIVVVALDGKIHLVNSNSSEIVWSFTPTIPLYSSSQSQSSNVADFYFLIGDDWEIYSNGLGNEKMKNPLSIEELIRSVPVTSSHGGVLLNYEISIALLIDAKDGRIMYAFKSDSDKNKHVVRRDGVGGNIHISANFLKIEKSLYVCRKQYAMKCLSRRSNKYIWYIYFSDTETSFPLDCRGSVFIYKIQNESSIESLFHPVGVPRSPSLPAGVFWSYMWFYILLLIVLIAGIAVMVYRLRMEVRMWKSR